MFLFADPDQIKDSRYKYVIDNILDFLGFPYTYENENFPESDYILLSYGNSKYEIESRCKGIISIYKSETEISGISGSEYIPVRDEATDSEIFVPRSMSNGDECLISLDYSDSVKHYRINWDLVKTSFWLLSCWEEYLNLKRGGDDFRFTPDKTQKRNEIIFKPPINQYALILKELVRLILSETKTAIIQKARFPKGAHFALCLTHDIDNAGYYPTHPIKQLLRFQRLFGWNTHLMRVFTRYIFDYAKNVLHKPKTINEIRKIIMMEEKYSARSAFYISIRNTIHDGSSSCDPNYNIKWEDIRDSIRLIKKSGNEVGIHGSYNFGSYCDSDMLLKEKEALEGVVGGKIVGGRQHYLRFSIPEIWDVYEKAGLLYDASLAYPEGNGFRSGIAYVYHPMNINTNRVCSLFEIPTAIHDTTLYSDCEFNHDEALAHSKGIIDTLEKNNGCSAIIWHNKLFFDSLFPGHAEVYEHILYDVRQRGGGLFSGAQLVPWVQAKNCIELVDIHKNNKTIKYTFKPKMDIEDMVFHVYPAAMIKSVSASMIKAIESKDEIITTESMSLKSGNEFEIELSLNN